jgi:hypothetical protein
VTNRRPCCLSFVVLALSSLAVACGSDAPRASSDVAGAPEVTEDAAAPDSVEADGPAQFCPRYAQSVCEGTAACGCTDDFEGPCVDHVQAMCERGVASRFGGILLGGLLFVPERADACISEVAAFARTCATPTESARPAACAEILRDAAALGGECASLGLGLRCASGAGFCDPETRRCTAVATSGPCGGHVACADTHLCEGGTCLPRLGAGDACSTDFRCTNGLVCAADGKCSEPGVKGAACARPEQCGEGLNCVDGACVEAAALGASCRLETCGSEAYCALPETRSCQPLAALGEGCNFRDEDCEAGLMCDWTQPPATCVNVPTLGERCPTGRCAAGAICAYPEERCVVAPRAGETCNPDFAVACEAGFGCDRETRTCVPGGDEGEPCVGGQLLCAEGLRCKPVGGEGTGVPTCARPGGEGTSCGSEDALCSPGFYCDWERGTCVAARPEGAPCDRDAVCGPASWCDYTQETYACRPLPTAEGEACGNLCGGGWRCDQDPGLCERDACRLRQ